MDKRTKEKIGKAYKRRKIKGKVKKRNK